MDYSNPQQIAHCEWLFTIFGNRPAYAKFRHGYLSIRIGYPNAESVSAIGGMELYGTWLGINDKRNNTIEWDVVRITLAALDEEINRYLINKPRENKGWLLSSGMYDKPVTNRPNTLGIEECECGADGVLAGKDDVYVVHCSRCQIELVGEKDEHPYYLILRWNNLVRG